MPAIANKLQQALVVAIGDTELLTSFDFCPDLTHFESIEGHLSFEDLPEERAICKHIHLLIVLALLEKFRGHIARCASKLHSSSTQISLENISELDIKMRGLTMNRARPKSQTLTLWLLSMRTF